MGVGVTSDERRMADFLGLPPSEPQDWPMEIIGRLIALERDEGHEALMHRLSRMTARQRLRNPHCGPDWKHCMTDTSPPLTTADLLAALKAEEK